MVMVPTGSTAPITGLMLAEVAPDVFHWRVERPPISMMAGFAVKALITGPLAAAVPDGVPALAPPGLA